MNPAALSALLGGDIGNFLAASTPGGIEAQEAQGQDQLIESTYLPKKFNGDKQSDFEEMGIVFDYDKTDDLFVTATLPAGWKKERTDHYMWSNLVDSNDNIRVGIFYKAAFYDRDAFMNTKRRYKAVITHTTPYGEDGWLESPEVGQVVDMWGGKDTVVFQTEAEAVRPEEGDRSAYYDAKNALQAEVAGWLDNNRPGWKSAASYWDEK